MYVYRYLTYVRYYLLIIASTIESASASNAWSCRCSTVRAVVLLPNVLSSPPLWPTDLPKKETPYFWSIREKNAKPFQLLVPGLGKSQGRLPFSSIRVSPERNIHGQTAVGFTPARRQRSGTIDQLQASQVGISHYGQGAWCALLMNANMGLYVSACVFGVQYLKHQPKKKRAFL